MVNKSGIKQINIQRGHAGNTIGMERKKENDKRNKVGKFYKPKVTKTKN